MPSEFVVGGADGCGLVSSISEGDKLLPTGFAFDDECSSVPSTGDAKLFSELADGDAAVLALTDGDALLSGITDDGDVLLSFEFATESDVLLSLAFVVMRAGVSSALAVDVLTSSGLASGGKLVHSHVDGVRVTSSNSVPSCDFNGLSGLTSEFACCVEFAEFGPGWTSERGGAQFAVATVFTLSIALGNVVVVSRNPSL